VVSVERPYQRLVRFKRVHLDQGESRTVTFEVHPSLDGAITEFIQREIIATRCTVR
jgi:hypothetical protein